MSPQAITTQVYTSPHCHYRTVHLILDISVILNHSTSTQTFLKRKITKSRTWPFPFGSYLCHLRCHVPLTAALTLHPSDAADRPGSSLASHGSFGMSLDGCSVASRSQNM